MIYYHFNIPTVGPFRWADTHISRQALFLGGHTKTCLTQPSHLTIPFCETKNSVSTMIQMEPSSMLTRTNPEVKNSACVTYIFDFREKQASNIRRYKVFSIYKVHRPI